MVGKRGWDEGAGGSHGRGGSGGMTLAVEPNLSSHDVLSCAPLSMASSPRSWSPLDIPGDPHSRSTTPTHLTFEDARLLSPSPDMFPSRPAPSRSHSTGSFVSSPLNPSSANPLPHSPTSPFASLSSRSPRRLSSHGSMILYRLADDRSTIHEGLLPPKFASVRNSVVSSSGDSYMSLKSDSKYPSGVPHNAFGLVVPYEYDPTLDQMEPPDDEDILHDPRSDSFLKSSSAVPWRGFFNVGLLLILVLGLLTLFVFYPVYSYYSNAARNAAITGNLRINATGMLQISPCAPFSSFVPTGQSPVL